MWLCVLHDHIYFMGVYMEQERLNLYMVDMKYIRNLHNIDDRV